MPNQLPPAVRDNGLVEIPEAELSTAIQVTQHVMHMNEVLRHLKENPQLGNVIEKARQRMQALLRKMSTDAKVALQIFGKEHPQYLPIAEANVACDLTSFHEAVRKLCGTLCGFCEHIRASVDTDAFLSDLAKHLGVVSLVNSGAADCREAAALPVGVQGATTAFAPVALPAQEGKVTHADRFVQAMNAYDCHQLLLDVLSEDDEKERRQSVQVLVDNICQRVTDGGAERITNGASAKLVSQIAAFLSAIRTNDRDHPYHLKVSNHALLGLIPEVPLIKPEDVDGSINRWITDRVRMGSDVTGQPVPVHRCGKLRDEKLYGAGVLYWGTGGETLLTIKNGNGRSSADPNAVLRTTLKDAYSDPNVAKRPVAFHFYDKHELGDTYLSLPKARIAELRMQLKDTDIMATVYRDAQGKFVVEDAHGARPGPLREGRVTDQQIISDPFKHFDPTNAAMEWRE